MGDRGNILVLDDFVDDVGIYLYSHWDGSNLETVLRKALSRGARWDDSPYLARIIFSEMIRDDLDTDTGYGVSAVCGDGRNVVWVVDPANERVALRNLDSRSRVVSPEGVSFQEFVT